jgi:hypothetical protein
MAISGTSYNQTVPILREFLSLSPSFFFRLDVALDLEVDITRKYTGKYFFEEAQGLSDGSGVDLKVNMTFISILDIPTSYRNSKPRSSTLCCLFPVWSELSLYIECRGTLSEIYIQFICTSFQYKRVIHRGHNQNIRSTLVFALFVFLNNLAVALGFLAFSNLSFANI